MKALDRPASRNPRPLVGELHYKLKGGKTMKKTLELLELVFFISIFYLGLAYICLLLLENATFAHLT
jgi:hypothetical protein